MESSYPVFRDGAIAISNPRDGNGSPSEIRRKPIAPGFKSTISTSDRIVIRTKDDQDLPKVLSSERLGKTDVKNSIAISSFELQPSREDLTIAKTTSLSTSISTSASTSTTFGNISETTDSSTLDPSSSSSASSYVQKAYRDARHFAGGLITHPSESTKHFSILRHSSGLVLYQGCATTLAISIFSDAPLPSDRQVWLQNKGWSGKTGMRVKALVGSNGSWLNVTPTHLVSAEQLNVSDERAWQRDIKKFLKKTKYPKHMLRETLVVRIPVEASDGYFQLVLCPGEKKKVLCPSPVFRILSTSTSPSSIRGASLSTLPLELGAMALATYANNTVGRMISPATSAAQVAIQPFMPSATKIEVATKLYSTSGTQDMIKSTIEDGNKEYYGTRAENLTHIYASDGDIQNGPKPPYPICFGARTEKSMDHCDYFSVPTMKLTGITEHIYHQLRGHYCAWVQIRGAHKGQNSTSSENESWSQAVLSAIPVRAADLVRANVSQASKKIFKLHFISNYFESEIYDGKKLDVKVMGFIRPDIHATQKVVDIPAHDMEEEIVASLNDITFTQMLLSQASFAPDSINDDQPRRGVLERATSSYATTRLAAQRQVDKMPLHRVGLRMDVDRMRDKAIGVNGFYVIR